MRIRVPASCYVDTSSEQQEVWHLWKVPVEGDFRIGSCAIRPQLNEIEREGGEVATVEPRSMAVLVHLADHPGDLCTRQAILTAVWGDAFVGEEVLTHCIWDLRRAFGDSARQPQYIQTLPRKGYRLLADVAKNADDDTPRYRLIEEVGAGAMGVIWRAEDSRLERAVALKFLPETWNHDARAKRRFEREAQAAAALDHPNVCPLYEIDETDDGRLFLVMPFYDGETVAARIARGPVPWRRAAKIAADAGRGLAAAHARGIVHRDVKPANMMLVSDDRRNDEQVKVLDFGVARFGRDATRLTATTVSPGTPAYKSPEQSRGEEVDARTDVWALGVVLYEMLCGRVPFPADYEQAMVHAILERPPVPVADAAPDAPAALAAVVDRALDKEPLRRFASMHEMVEAIETCLASNPARGESAAIHLPPTAPAVASRPGRRWGLVGLGVAIIIGLAIVVSQAQRADPTPELRVAILSPIIDSGGRADVADLEAAGSAALLASQSALARLQGVSPLDPREHDSATTARAAARASAADEVLGMTVEASGRLGRITLRRFDAEGRLRWTDALEVPLERDDALLLATGVQAKLRQAYPERAPRDDDGALDVRDEDYRVFLELRRRHDADGVEASAEDLATVDGLLASSPRFLEGHILGAEMAWRLGRRTRDATWFDAASVHAGAAAELAPADPRPTLVALRVALAAGRTNEADAALDHLESLEPGSPRTRFARALVWADRGDLDGAIDEAGALVALRPSTTYLYQLAALEDRAGQHNAARAHLRQLLERAPGNRRGLSRLAELELSYGDLDAAQTLYRQLLESRPSRRYWTNLGIAHFLGGDWAAAVDAYTRALTLAPEHMESRYNLAEAQAALGQVDEAAAGFRGLVRELEQPAAPRALDPTTRMIRALCHAHLGNARVAVDSALATLQDHPEHADVTYQSAIVYALVGDRNSALVAVTRALDLGLAPRWFRVPAFASLADDPAFKALLAASSG